MSRRPHFTAISLSKLLGLASQQDPELVRTLTDHFDDFYSSLDSSDRQQAHKLISDLVMFDSPGRLPDVEDETFQIVVVALAHYDQEVLPSTTPFWEDSVAWLYDQYSQLDSFGRRLHSWLYDGRPLFGSTIQTSWTFYAYLMGHELPEFSAFIARHSDLADMYDFQSAQEWLQRVQASQKDIFFYAS